MDWILRLYIGLVNFCPIIWHQTASNVSFNIPDTSFEIISLDLSDAYIFSKNSATKYAKAGDS